MKPKSCGNCKWWREYQDNDHNRFGICEYKPVPFAANVLETMHDECEDCVCHIPSEQGEGSADRITIERIDKGGKK